MKAIILCGGLGTRLGSLTRETPKPLLAVAGKPFVDHVMQRLVQADMTDLVLAAGFQWQKLSAHIGDTWCGVPIQYSVEASPLGTGGAIKAAMASAHVDEALVVNGDTLFDIDIAEFLRFATSQDTAACIALRHVPDCSRYGRVTVDPLGRLLSFGEKGHAGPGLINGGIYYLRRIALDAVQATAFSFEVDFLSIRQPAAPLYGMAFNDYFVDIGVPADLARAQTELLD